ncbi:hypothetical protein B0A52_05732 [Exophiala mesophila]|uniref:Calcineurin-like phosphoesterase domain-containing protein n=1 Tax=Exophiala mesophila TaxID=212818 RepID=A0A438N2I7_EXOME|nr:hypothetical protein B0A52_05732 [Exophiala mesophila]
MSTLIPLLTTLPLLLSTYISGTAATHPIQRPFLNAPEALNPRLTNTIETDAITLHYNGSGPVPDYDELSPVPDPITPLSQHSIQQSIVDELVAIIDTTAYPDNCSKCIAVGQILHTAAITQPVSVFSNVLVQACNTLPFVKASIRADTCESQFTHTGGLGPYFAQLFSKMSLATGDYQALCAMGFNGLNVCEDKGPVEIDENLYFDPKPDWAENPPPPSGKPIDVLHLSDWHLDPRYDIASEANCSQYLCCRPYSTNTERLTSRDHPSVPASRFGSFFCDTPPDLALSAFHDMPQFFDIDALAFTIFTGDIVSHDHDDALSRAYVSYSEEVSYRIFKTMLREVPVYATLGNHDTLPKDFSLPHSLESSPTNTSTNPIAWNYDLVSSLWQEYSWLNKTEASFAKTHYGAYAATTPQGLRVISLNSDFWYKANPFNYFNTTNPDPNGLLSWLAQELTACEKRRQRVWIIAHVLTGYDGTTSLANPSALFYSIVRRFSPYTIAAVFFGHTHKDQLQLFYDYLPDSINPVTGHRDTTKIDYSKPLQVGYVGPSITPLTGLNSGYRVYQVDSKTFEILGAQTYFANINDSLEWTKPVWKREYDVREAYSNPLFPGKGVGNDIYKAKPNIQWPGDAPLNATFWHRVTESMLLDPDSEQSLLQKYNRFETKSSASTVHRGNDETQPEQEVCFIRSGSAALGKKCRDAFGGKDARGSRERAFGVC